MHKAILILAGLALAVVGAATLFAPAAFHALNGTELGDSAALLSEIRASGGALLATGVLVVAGAFAPRLTATAALVGTILHLSYGLSRVLGLALDGLPPASLLAAAVAEVLLGLACLRVLGSRPA
ncbi:DUF4345 domain-containing protein [Actinosynnema sp. NPDC047251]|uniref:DUF4345 domain-containing protein n=1 Tax=Saccharothrix espanaensis TaxID=103731 RepID=UPI000313F9A6|nr:DUF4345 domain-containing protein [Saccharothrix espanaensis]